MRGLSGTYMNNLQTGFLKGILDQVKLDKDFDLEIRNNSINIYYKGNSLVKLTENRNQEYKVELHKKFKQGLSVPVAISNQSDAADFLSLFPSIKENIIMYGKSSLETEYEQLIIRANNLEIRNNTDYFIVDRQYTSPTRDRFDLTALVWETKGRYRGQTVPLSFIEIKFALNSDISKVHNQIQRYYNIVANAAAGLATEVETIFKQKIQLGLYNQSGNRLEAMKTLKISRNIDEYEFMLFLVDYNPNSTLLNLDILKQLPCANQIKVYYGGFGLWRQSIKIL